MTHCQPAEIFQNYKCFALVIKKNLSVMHCKSTYFLFTKCHLYCGLGHSEVAEGAVYAIQKINNTRVRQLYSGYSSAANVPRSLFLSVK